MSTLYKRSLHIFRRDLRLQDNRALIAALDQSEEVVPAFIFDPRQIEPHVFRSSPALQYMLESLEYLDSCLRKRDSQLFCWRGVAEEVVSDIIGELEIDAVFFNFDYTPFARARDTAMHKAAEESGKAVHGYHDALLNAPGTTLKDNGEPYSVYTPFFKKAAREPVDAPQQNRAKNFIASTDSNRSLESMQPDIDRNPDLFLNGGRKKALAALRKIGELDNYSEDRNIPAKGATSGLSAAMKFGTVSAREFYHKVSAAFDSSHTLIRELYWRDFFTHIGWHYPHVFAGCFHKKYDSLKWSRSKKRFDAWCEGKTGYPIVDAGMRELNHTGYMHNRVRMVTASFLVKDLHIDWRKGEEYFARHLVDYDPAVNNGNWQWAASTGCDAQPYFRIFNPWRQQERFDADCVYVKRWLPELAEASAKEILALEKGAHIEGYPAPIVIHAEEKEVAEDMYRDVV